MKDFLEERYEKIVERVELEGRVTVKDLAKEFKVTEDCIRKDLRELESREKLKRCLVGLLFKEPFKKLKQLRKEKTSI